MSQRLDYFKLAGEACKKLVEFTQGAHKASVDHTLGDLITLRASQLNGCAFCVDMHVKEAKIHGERELRLYHVPVWRESQLFSGRERAALEWTELLTRLDPTGIPDDAYGRVAQQFTDQELVDITMLVIAINSWNRLGVAFRSEPGSADKAYGLDKANLR